MKEYPHKMELAKVWKYFEEFPLAHLATIDEDWPRVRSMALLAYKEKLWVSSQSSTSKIKQLEENTNVEFVVVVKGDKGIGTFRVTCRAKIIEDPQLRKEVASVIPWFSSYWESPQDPEYTLIRLDLIQILYDHPDDRKKYTISL